MKRNMVQYLLTLVVFIGAYYSHPEKTTVQFNATGITMGSGDTIPKKPPYTTNSKFLPRSSYEYEGYEVKGYSLCRCIKPHATVFLKRTDGDTTTINYNILAFWDDLSIKKYSDYKRAFPWRSFLKKGELMVKRGDSLLVTKDYTFKIYRP